MKIRSIFLMGLIGILLTGFFIQCEKIVYTYDDQKPQLASNLSILSVTDSTAQLYWETDEACHIQIKYGATTDYDSIYQDDENREIHNVILSGLEPHTLYHFRIYFWDFAGNGPIKLPDTIFTTLANEYSYLREGWQFIREKNYTSAKTSFDAAYQINPYLAEIYAAYGWLNLKIDSLTLARANLATAFDMERQLPITLAGIAILNMIDDQPAEAISNINRILNANDQWVYRYNSDISWKSLRLTLAQAYYQTDQLSAAQRELDILWPENGLNPNLPASWIVNKQTYNTFEEAFIAALNYLIANPEKIG